MVGAGSVNVALNPPPELVVMLPGLVLTAEPSYDTVMPELEAKLVPVIVMLLPANPDIGFSVIAGDVNSIVNVVADAVFDGELVPTELIADTL